MSRKKKNIYLETRVLISGAKTKVITESVSLVIFTFFFFYTKTYSVGSHWNGLNEAIPKTTHKVCFGRKRNKKKKNFLNIETT